MGVTSTPMGAAPSSSTKMQRTSSYFFVCAQKVLVTQKVSKTKLASFGFGLDASVERAVLRPQLFGRVTRHPESFFERHRWFRPGLRSRLVAA